MKNGILHAPSERLVPHLRPRRRPFVTEPDSHRVSLSGVRIGVDVQRDLAPKLGIAMDQPDTPHDLFDRAAQQLLPACRNLDLVARHRGSLLAEGPFPVGTLRGLDAILVRHLHEDAFRDQLFQLARDAVAEGAGVRLDDGFHKQIGERLRVRADSEVHRVLAGQLPDQEDHAA